MNGLESNIDEQDEDYKCLVESKIDARSYLRLVDRLAVALGGDREAMIRAARLVYEHFLDAKPKDCEPKPSWFDGWLEQPENAELVRKVMARLSEIIRQIATVNETSDCSYLDEGMAYDWKVEALNELAEKIIAKISGQERKNGNED